MLRLKYSNLPFQLGIHFRVVATPITQPCKYLHVARLAYSSTFLGQMQSKKEHIKALFTRPTRRWYRSCLFHVLWVSSSEPLKAGNARKICETHPRKYQSDYLFSCYAKNYHSNTSRENFRSRQTNDNNDYCWLSDICRIRL